MFPTERVSVFIDGSNLYYKLKDLEISRTSEFSYRGLCQLLALNRKLSTCNYYVGVVKADSSNKKVGYLQSKQNKLFGNLRNQNVILYKGYLMNNHGVYHEKGVDVNIAVDLLVGAYENHYDTAILISSDTDLIPAINKIRSLGKKLEYVGFAHNPSIAMRRHASRYTLLRRDMIESFIKKEKA